MKQLAIGNKIGKIFSKTKFKVQKHSPEILIFAGITGTVVATVMACKATTKLEDILGESKETINEIKKASENLELADKYSQTDAKKDLTITYVQTGVKVVRLYAPAAVVGILSITSILVSNNILKKRNVALAAAYTAIDTSFREYRDRVVQRFGEEVDKELRYNIRKEKIEETVVDENGKEKKVKTTVKVADLQNSDYAVYFDKDTSRMWERDHGYNMDFLKCQQAYANDKFSAYDRPIFLNEIHEMLGLPWTQAGQVVGWSKESEKGDMFIDFRIQEVYRKYETEVDGEIRTEYKKSILLDFNVDGNAWDKIKNKK